ncbi:hypothetical protein LJB62_06880 [Bacillus sp. DFI.2.34]|nr:hypothetical protein [Bacillus sp. DFI.2.34]
MATKPNLVAILRRKTPFFCDEASFRHRFWSKTSQFWRRGLFSSPFLVENLIFLATKPNLVVIFGRKPLNFGDETKSRRHFWSKTFHF